MVRQSRIQVELQKCGHAVSASDALGSEIRFLAERLGVPINVRATVIADPMMKWHYGVGYHTQLRLSLATALAMLYHLRVGPRYLTDVALRGGTSGIGIHGFWHGGVLFDGGRRRTGSEVLSPSSAVTAPASTPLLFSRPTLPFAMVVAQAKGWNLVYGEQERALFAGLTPIPEAEASHCARLVYQDLMSSVAEADFDAFCEAVDDIQACGFKSRELRFRGDAAMSVATALRGVGLRGVGMSSWGPTWFGFAENRDSAMQAIAKLRGCELLESVCFGEAAPSAQVQLDDQPAVAALSAVASDLEANFGG